MTHVKLASLELRIDRVRREPFAEDEKKLLKNHKSVLYDQNIIWSTLKIVAVKVKSKVISMSVFIITNHFPNIPVARNRFS